MIRFLSFSTRIFGALAGSGLRSLCSLGAFFGFVLLAALAPLVPAAAQVGPQITIGVPQFDKTFNALASDHILARLIARDLTARLVRGRREGPAAGFRLDLADSMSVDQNASHWLFSVKQGIFFSNGLPVTTEDVRYSLARCQHEGALPAIAGVAILVEQPEFIKPAQLEVRARIDGASGSGGSEARSNAVMSQIAACPILESRTAARFGHFLGNGSSLVSAGAYQIADFNFGKDVVLVPVVEFGRARRGSPRVEFRSIDESRQGLTALRLGNIDALFTENVDVLTVAQADATLEIGKCDGNTMVLRKGLRVVCMDGIDLAQMKYVG